jgi:hypothetical protein
MPSHQVEGEHTAVVVIPFTLCSLLLCHHITGERARVAHRHHPGDRAPGKKIPLRETLSVCSRLIGDGRMKRPCKAALAAHPCASPRPSVNASAIFGRTRSRCKPFISMVYCYRLERKRKLAKYQQHTKTATHRLPFVYFTLSPTGIANLSQFVRAGFTLFQLLQITQRGF